MSRRGDRVRSDLVDYELMKINLPWMLFNDKIRDIVHDVENELKTPRV